MNNREQQILDDILNILKDRLNPQKIILFGSRAKKKSSLSSDFDFAVACAKIDPNLKRGILEEIEKISGLYHVDIVYFNDVDKDFQNIILSTGNILYEQRT